LFSAGIEPDIHESAAIGSTERVASFVDRDNSLLNSQSSEGFTPLALAAHFGHLDTVQLLVDRGADVNLVSEHQIGVTPIHAALFGQRIDIVFLLLEHGADPDIRRGGKGLPRAGWTALHYAASLGAKDLVTALIEHGVNPTATDDEGLTPLDIARNAGMLKVTITLEKALTDSGGK
jgi:ankyrin repeat protein